MDSIRPRQRARRSVSSRRRLPPEPAMRVCLFECRAANLDPIALTRPVFDLRCGLTTLGEKQRHAFGASEWSAWVRPMLADVVRQTHPGVPVNDANFQADLWVNSRWLPSEPCCLPQ